MNALTLAVAGQPLLQPRPLCDERLVGDLDGIGVSRQ
jgi:hypothetical protein